MKNMKESAAEVKETLSSVKELVEPIAKEVEGEEELFELKAENDRIDELQDDSKRSQEISEKAKKEKEQAENDGEYYEAKYREKITARCEEQLSRGSEKCRWMLITKGSRSDTHSYLKFYLHVLQRNVR